jgi:very-short-patch-repair endonuclease
MSNIEDKLLFYIQASGLPEPEREVMFSHDKKWRFDFAYPQYKIAIEVEGVLWRSQGRHQTALGVEGDCQKYNAAVLGGWRVLRFTQRMVESGEALKVIEIALRHAEIGDK